MKFSRVVVCHATLVLVFGFLSSLQAQTGFAGGVPWQVGDIIVCFGTTGGVGGTCNALRLVGGTPVLLDQFSDGLLGDNRGVAINNTLHVLTTDNAAGNQSDVVVYSIASLNPSTGTAIAHAPASTFNPSPNNAQAIVVNKAGQIFVGNAGSGLTPTPTIVELNPDGTLASASSIPPLAMPSNPLTLPGNCTDVKGQLLSMDLSKDGSVLYLTSTQKSFSTSISTPNGGSIQKLTLATGTCAPFASFGNGVALNGVQDVPANALTGLASCNGSSCPADETILVAAEGFFDSDGATESLPPAGIPDQADDTNICTNAVNSALVSCALLLDTSGPGLTASRWAATTRYSTGTQVLDANLHVQQVVTPGTSGCHVPVTTETCYYTSSPFHPAWQTNGTTTVDNAVTWMDEGACGGAHLPKCPRSTWAANTAYTVGQQVTDLASHIQQVVVAGTSGPGPSQPAFNDRGGTTIDGLTWIDLGTSVVARYPVPASSTLQALSLDPLVSDCVTNNCSSSVPSPTVSNFWLGDSMFPNFYEVNFGTGSVTPFSVNANTSTGACTTCVTATNAEGLRIYGAEGANQPDLTKLFATNSFSSAPNLQKVQFPLPTNNTDTNSMTVELFPTGTTAIPLSIYASQMPMASAPANGGNNSGATDPPASFPCEPTTSNKANCILWKIDADPSASSILATKFSTVNTTPPTIDINTDVFVDENFDVTQFVGNADPGGTRLSVHSLNEVGSFTGTTGGSCVYTSPAPKCFQNNNNISFKFSCSTFTGDVSTLQPRLTLVTPPPGSGSVPQPILPLVGTNGTSNYRFDPTSGQWIFNWQVTQLGTFLATTDDLSHQVQTFYEIFSVENTCPSSVTIASVSPTSGSVAGGTKVTITGTGYESGAIVTFGDVQATNVKVASNGKSITALTPAGSAGTVSVTVINPDGGIATFPSGYTYTSP